MSDIINNREYRREVLKELIGKLHEGASVEEVKKEFEETFSGVSAAEISEVEQALISEGMPVSEVQRLCDVHAAVFKGSIEEIHSPAALAPHHPAEVFKSENRALESLISQCIRPRLATLQNSPEEQEKLRHDIARLMQIERHYQKKENIFFPYLEKYGITAPPKVMWGVDDEIRALLKKALKAAEPEGKSEKIAPAAEEACARIEEMIFKEENIMLPMLKEALSEDEWVKIGEEYLEFGYCLIDPPPEWKPGEKSVKIQEPLKNGMIDLPTGSLHTDEVMHLLNTLPFDITFVDYTDTVKYFSQGTDRIFARTKAILGRKVTNCHPPASVHIVEKIVEDLKSGKKDSEDFWIRMGERFVYIRYFAVRNEAGEYLGTMEVTQNIAPIQAITGEKRLVSE